MIITFCGHAQFQRKKEYEQKVFSFLEEKIGNQSAELYLGGYGEFDRFAYDCCQKYKKQHPKVSLVFITPYLMIEHQKNHLIDSKATYDAILYPEIENKPLKLAILYRNRYMVEKADYVIAYIDHSWGGAYTTYQYAKRKGKVILNLGRIAP